MVHVYTGLWVMVQIFMYVVASKRWSLFMIHQFSSGLECVRVMLLYSIMIYIICCQPPKRQARVRCGAVMLQITTDVAAP